MGKSALIYFSKNCLIAKWIGGRSFSLDFIFIQLQRRNVPVPFYKGWQIIQWYTWFINLDKINFKVNQQIYLYNLNRERTNKSEEEEPGQSILNLLVLLMVGCSSNFQTRIKNFDKEQMQYSVNLKFPQGKSSVYMCFSTSAFCTEMIDLETTFHSINQME